VVTFGARLSHADVRVERDASADACPDPATFAERIREGLGEASERTRTITIRFERSPGGYSSTVQTSDGMQRKLTEANAAGCDGLAEATLLVARLALDSATGPPSPPSNTADAAAGANAANANRAAERDDARRESAVKPRGRAVHPELLVGALASFGIGGAFSPGARTTAALALRPWTFGITGFILPPATQPFGVGRVAIAAMAGGLDLCYRARLVGFLLGVCGRGEIGALTGTARGFANNESATRALLLTSVLARGQRRIGGPLGVFAELGAVVPMVRERFEIQGVGMVYDPPPVAAMGGIGMLVDFE
jgi:hypothetical protein